MKKFAQGLLCGLFLVIILQILGAWALATYGPALGAYILMNATDGHGDPLVL